MTDMADRYKRKSLRLAGYDYSHPGAYFVTLCVTNKHEMLGEIHVGAGSARPYVELSDHGKIVEKNLVGLQNKYPHVSISNYVIMPNHIHCILHINGYTDHGRADPAPTLGQIVEYFKYQTIREIDISGFWQRSYHDHIIQSENEYSRISQYIDINPSKWAADCYYVTRTL